MQKLPDFVPAFSHHLKPLTRDRSQFTCMLIHASMAGSRSTAPLNRNNSVLILLAFFETTIPLPAD